MFENLKKKWKVSGMQLLLILTTFALGGTCCGYLGRKILALIHFNNDVLFIFAYALLITLLWPICVLIISVPLGQFKFFTNYLNKIKNRMFGK
jgi:uncharacterized membrane protein YwzB